MTSSEHCNHLGYEQGLQDLTCSEEQAGGLLQACRSQKFKYFFIKINDFECFEEGKNGYNTMADYTYPSTGNAKVTEDICAYKTCLKKWCHKAIAWV